MTVHRSAPPYPGSLSLVLAKERVAELRAEAERSRQVRAARAAHAPRRTPAWPAGLVAALRASLTGSSPGPRNVARRRPCPTC